MIEFRSLASSSSGNVYIVTFFLEGGQRVRLLLECGIPFKRIQQALDFSIGDIDFCLLTHEHMDHSLAVMDVLAYDIPLYMSEGTAIMLNLAEDVNILPAKKTAEIYGRDKNSSVKVLPFPVRHDAAEPFGYLIASGEDKLLFATDTAGLQYRFPGVTEIAVECNHDKGLLAPDTLEPWQYRAMRHHMDIDTVINYLGQMDLTKCRRIHLLHLSSRHSDEAAFVGRIYKEFGIPVTACAAG
ncbi:MAG: MBL fold metallo-hydrolase [Ruminococcaceae bacterium]|nr:MBL fold metallo-hydrolase [Oscillospiraceae bacterium]